MKDTLSKFMNFKFKKGWMWLLYIDVFLTLSLFLVSYLARASGVGPMLARTFHSYNLYIINPIPDLGSLTGVIGLGIHIGFIAYALKKKDIFDGLICTGISALVFLYFLYEINYKLSYLLNFA